MQRIDHWNVVPDVMKALLGATEATKRHGVDERLIELVEKRVAHTNGCTYCVDYHDRVLEKLGETPERRAEVANYERSTRFDARERAAFAWADAVTDVVGARAPEAAFDAARELFAERELTALTAAIALAGAWNRMAIAMRTPVPPR